MPSGSEIIPYRVHPERVDPVCRGMDRRALVIIALGAAGALFSAFWVIFGIIVWAMGVATTWTGLLLIVVGGALPLIGSTWLLGLGISRRVSSSRLRNLATLAHRFPTLTAVHLAAALSIPVDDADRLLALALRGGLVSAFPSTGPRA